LRAGRLSSKPICLPQPLAAAFFARASGMANANLPRDAFEFNAIAHPNLVDFAHIGLRRFDIRAYGP
jgi:hypothetical protein